MNNEKIAILLTVFNRKDKTLQCLSLLSRQVLPEGCSCDIYITDGGSTDGTVDAVKSIFPKVDIQVERDVYWNQGMIYSWKRAIDCSIILGREYDYFLWLNDDTFIYEDCISALLIASRQKQDEAIIVGSCVDTKTKSILTYGGRDTSGKVASASSDGKPVPVVMINGNIVLVPDFVYKKIGMLDSYFTHACGDFDYGLRARAAGIGMWQVGHPLGECDLHERIDKWCDPEVPLIKRWMLMHRPNGMPPQEIFHLENRHYGFITALKHYFTIHLRCILPNLWIRMGKTKIKTNYYVSQNAER